MGKEKEIYLKSMFLESKDLSIYFRLRKTTVLLNQNFQGLSLDAMQLWLIIGECGAFSSVCRVVIQSVQSQYRSRGGKNIIGKKSLSNSNGLW